MSAPESSSPRRGSGRRKQRSPRRIRSASESESFLERAAPPAQAEPSVTAVDQRDQAEPSSVAAQAEPSVTAEDQANQPGPSTVQAPAPAPAPADIDASVVQPPTDSLPHEVCAEESDPEVADEPEVVDEEPPIPNLGAAVGNGSVPTPENNSAEERPLVPAPGASRVPRKRIVIPLGLPAPDGYQLLEGRGRVPARRDIPAAPELHMTATSDEDEEAD